MIVKVPISYLVPAVIVLAMGGSYALIGNIMGPLTLAVFSLVGWLFQRYNFMPPAAVVGLLLGAFVERQFVYSHQISGGDLSFIFGRPIALVMMALLVASVVHPIVKNYRRRKAALTEIAGASGPRSGA